MLLLLVLFQMVKDIIKKNINFLEHLVFLYWSMRDGATLNILIVSLQDPLTWNSIHSKLRYM